MTREKPRCVITEADAERQRVISDRRDRPVGRVERNHGVDVGFVSTTC